MKRCGFCNRFFKLVICLLIVQYFIFNSTAAMLYEPVLATGRSCLSGVGADILIPPFWFSVGHREGGMCIAAKGWYQLSGSIS
jgi:hypothetical protein